jgi:hypothetical protein
MGDARILAGGEVQYTAMLVVWEVHGRTGGESWRMFLDEELADLKAAMERTLGETEEVDTLFDHDRMCMENRWCPWCCTQAAQGAHLNVAHPSTRSQPECPGPMALGPELNEVNCK